MRIPVPKSKESKCALAIPNVQQQYLLVHSAGGCRAHWKGGFAWVRNADLLQQLAFALSTIFSAPLLLSLKHPAGTLWRPGWLCTYSESCAESSLSLRRGRAASLFQCQLRS